MKRFFWAVAVVALVSAFLWWSRVGFGGRGQTSQFRLVWSLPKPPGGGASASERELEVGFLAPGELLVLSSSGRSQQRAVHVRVVELGGQVLTEFTVRGEHGDFRLQGISRAKRLAALNCGEGVETNMPTVIDVDSQKVLGLQSGLWFPIGVEGNSQPFSPAGDFMMVHRMSGGAISIVSSETGKRVRDVVTPPTRRGALIRWVAGRSPSLMWYDPRSRSVCQEGAGHRVQCRIQIDASAHRHGVLSQNGSALALYAVSRKGILNLDLYDTRSGQSIRRISKKLRSGEQVGSVAWSPDGVRLCVLLQKDYEPSERFLLLSKTGSLRSVSRAGWRFGSADDKVAWSPDGRRLAIIVYDSSAYSAGELLEGVAVLSVCSDRPGSERSGDPGSDAAGFLTR